MPKRKYLILFTVAFAIFALFISTEVMASGSCGLPLGECWHFTHLQHRITFVDVEIVPEGKKFIYKIERLGKPTIEHWNFGHPGCRGGCFPLGPSDPSARQFDLGAGDNLTYVGVGDFERCYIRQNAQLSKGEPQTWFVTVPSWVGLATIPVYIRDNQEKTEVGTIFGPACQAIVDRSSITQRAQECEFTCSRDEAGVVTCTSPDCPVVEVVDVNCYATVVGGNGNGTRVIALDHISEDCILHGYGSGECTCYRIWGRNFCCGPGCCD